MLEQLFWLSLIQFHVGDANLNDDLWVLDNMMGNVEELRQSHGWFNAEDTNPCSWDFVTCNNENRVVGLGDFNNVSDGGRVNTSYWPLLIQNISFYNNDLKGELILENLPNTIQNINIETGFSLNLTTTLHSNQFVLFMENYRSCSKFGSIIANKFGNNYFILFYF